jgi:hypothetical protein
MQQSAPLPLSDALDWTMRNLRFSHAREIGQLASGSSWCQRYKDNGICV